MIPEELKEHKDIKFFDDFITIPLTTFFYKNRKVERYKNTINKFYAYNLIDYNGLIFIDADIFLLKNIDDMFDLQTKSKLVVSTYSPKRVAKQTYPLNGVMLLTPEIGKYDSIVNFSRQIASVTDDESLIYNLHLDAFNNKNWSNEINTFENLHYNKGLIFIHANNLGFHYYLIKKYKLNAENLHLLLKDKEEDFSLLIIGIYQAMLYNMTAVQFSYDEIEKGLIRTGSLSHYKDEPFLLRKFNM